MKLSVKKQLAILTIPVLISACSSMHRAQIHTQDLQHHKWELVKIDGKDVILKENEKLPTLEIGENLMANGNAGCNNFFGQGELKDDRFRIEHIAMTMQMCSDNAMQSEQAVSQTLSNWSDVTLSKETLTLRNDKHTLTYSLSDWVK